MADTVNFRGDADISVVGRELFRCFKGEKKQTVSPAFFSWFFGGSGDVSYFRKQTENIEWNWIRLWMTQEKIY